MGHSGNDEMVPAMRTSSTKFPVMTAFKEHCSGKRTNTELSVVELIRAIHSDKHVTTVSPHTVDLIGYAAAGHAEAHLITAGDSYQSTRVYQAPETRMEAGEGKLGDSVDFGHYEYKWQGQYFPMYHVEWNDDFGGVESFHFILTDRNTVSSAHSATADRLIMTCGKWTSELHDEIYVFDAGHWRKDEDLWKAGSLALSISL